MIGLSVRAAWDIKNSVSDLVNFDVDYYEIQLDNPIFKFPELIKQASTLLETLTAENKPLAFHLSYIDVNIAALDEGIRRSASLVLKQELEFVRGWNPLYVVIHTGKVSETFSKNQSVLERAHSQQKATITELLELATNYSIPLALENRQKSSTIGVIQRVKDISYYCQLFPSLHFVLDLGHLNTFHEEPETYLSELEPISNLPVIALHLSNNWGKDTHEMVTEGTAPITEMFSRYPCLKLKYLTIENKTIGQSVQSLDFLKNMLSSL